MRYRTELGIGKLPDDHALENELARLVIELQPVLDWVGPIVNGRHDQWKATHLEKAIALAKTVNLNPK